MSSARLAELQPGRSIQSNITIPNIPGVLATVAGIARVLVPFSKVRTAVLSFLRGNGGEVANLPVPEVFNAAAEAH